MEPLTQTSRLQTTVLSITRNNGLDMIARCVYLLCMLLMVMSITACTDEDGNKTDNSAEDASTPIAPVPTTTPLSALSVTDYVVVSTRRTGRTRMEYTLRIKVSNSSSASYESVLATLTSVPAHITIIDGAVNMANVPPNSTTASPDTFVIDVNLAIGTSFDDLVWDFVGDVAAPPPPPPSTGRPTQIGYFMDIDNGSIPGEATSESHKDWIELTAFTEGLHRDDVGATGTTRRRASFVFDGVTASKLVDRSSVKLREVLAEQRFFGEIKIDIINSCGGNLYTSYAITLSTAQIASLFSNTSNETIPVENVGLIYSRIESMYTPVAPDCTLLPAIFSTQDGELLSL